MAAGDDGEDAACCILSSGPQPTAMAALSLIDAMIQWSEHMIQFTPSLVAVQWRRHNWLIVSLFL
jgi:hypothetical protein